MMKTDLLKVALRQNAVFIPGDQTPGTKSKQLHETTGVLLANCAKLGFTFSEELLHTINAMDPQHKPAIFNYLKEVTGIDKNWTPLVKQWNVPTGETVMDHIITLFANVFHSKNGTRLACGHIIPVNTFPIGRYNGCPFCGTPFESGSPELSETANKLTVLELWTETDMKRCMNALLQSPVALDATQADSLELLLQHFDIDPATGIRIKETVMIVIRSLVEQNKAEMAAPFFQNVNDVLRYLWYEHTGFLQIVEPKVILKRAAANAGHIYRPLDRSAETKTLAKTALKLKFTRMECKQYAAWLNAVCADAERQCEIMHPKRGIWVRVIRALRLAEYANAKGFGNLKRLLDVFYNGTYEVWNGNVQQARLKKDAGNAFYLLKQRPGLFARSLFSTMLWFGPEVTLKHFREVMDEVPARLIFTLNMYAERYFDKSASRTVKPLGGISKRIGGNAMLRHYSDEALNDMQSAIRGLTLEVIRKRLTAAEPSERERSMYIDPDLYRVPLAIGERNEQVQDLPNALSGTRFPIEGSAVRLFMQWGTGLPAQHMDMDLSAFVIYEDSREYCSYANLVVNGCKHSGDIRSIPDKIGTAEYIEINLDALKAYGAKHVIFSCNAYSNGSLTPNMTVGWMNSKLPMRITSMGVAYSPADVQHKVRITQQLTKGLVFGALDVVRQEIVWLEMSYGGQVVQGMDTRAVEELIAKLDSRIKIGDLLRLKAEVQGIRIVDDPALADERYDLNWSRNVAEVSALFLG
jgi:hypothetical protein